MSWVSTNADSCTASGDWSGSKPTSGSEDTGNLTSSKTYTITCTGAGGSASDSVTVNVSGQPIPPTVDIKANGSDGPITIDYNTSATLSWTSTNADSCTASGDWSGSKPTSGSEDTGNLTSSKTYVITCTGAGGSASDSVTIYVGAQPVPALNISKTGRNLTKGQTNFTDSISADPSDEIEFKIVITSIGSATASNVQVKDTLPDKMTYTGDLKVDGTSFAGDILNGINVGNMNAGQTKTVTFKARVFSETYFGYGTTSLVNIAQTWADSVSQIVDTAIVNVTRTPPSPVSPGLSIEKLVRNITDNTSFSDLVSADPQDKIEFQIKVSSVGSTSAVNVIVEDLLPSKINYEGNLKIDGVASSGDILSGLNLGTLSPGASKTITFEAKVASEENFAYGVTTLVNTANTRADDISEIYDSASVYVTRTAPSLVDLVEISVEKKVRNLTSGQTSWYETVQAAPSDKIAFRIVITSTGSITASNVQIKDALPEKIDWYGNLKIDDVSTSLDITKGISIGDLAPGQSKTITFDALIAPEDQFSYGTTDLTNTALAYNVDTSGSNTAGIKVQKKAVAGAVTEVPTGVLSSLLVPFGVTMLLTYCLLLGFFFYQKVFVGSGIQFGEEISKVRSGIEDWYYSLRIFDSPEKSARRLQKTISEIKRVEG